MADARRRGERAQVLHNNRTCLLLAFSPSQAPAVHLEASVQRSHYRVSKQAFSWLLGPAQLLACIATIGLRISLGNALELSLKRSKPTVEPVPRGQPHHIYKVRVFRPPGAAHFLKETANGGRADCSACSLCMHSESV